MQIVEAFRAVHLFPSDYIGGLIEVRDMLTSGAVCMDVLGRPYMEAPWFYLPLTTTIKFTLSFLAMLVLGGLGVVAMGRGQRAELLFLLVPALLFLGLSTIVDRNGMGIWHLFPMLPFLLIAAAGGCVYLARRYRWAGALLVCLLVLHAVSSLRAYPNYLSYANEAWGGPENLYKHLPWTDQNQTYWEISRYMEKYPNTPCWVDSNWFVPASKYNVPCTQMGDHWEAELPLHMKGIVFVSGSWLYVYGHEGEPLSSFHAVEPTARLGGSAMLVYHGEFDTHLAAASALDNKVTRLLGADDNPDAILPLAREAVEIAPSSYRTHDAYCGALKATGDTRQALSECSVALGLAEADPRGRRAARGITDQMEGIYAMERLAVGAPSRGGRVADRTRLQ